MTIGVLLALTLCTSAKAEVLDVGGDFAAGGRNGLPLGWSFNQYKGYRPFADVTVAPSASGGVMTLSNVTGRSGTAVVTTNRYPAVKGEKVRISCEVKGRGTAIIGLDHYADGGVWNISADVRSRRKLPVTEEWRRHEFELHVGDGKAKTVSISLSVGCARGDEISMRNLSAEALHLLQTGGLDFVSVRRYYEDTFERPQPKRPVQPEIVRGPVSDGLLTQTHRGRYRVSGSTCLAEVRDVRAPRKDNSCFLGEFRLYGISPDTDVAYCFRSESGEVPVRLPRSVYGMSMPVDVVFHAGIRGEYAFSVTSLVDGRKQFHSGASKALRPGMERFTCALTVLPTGKTGKGFVELDNVVFGEDQGIVRQMELPKRKAPEPTFDPKERGWRLVFEEGFDGPAGTSFDTDKWFISYWDPSIKWFSKTNNGLTRLDGNGHLSITADFIPGTTNLTCGPPLQSVQTWCYGYFEARVRFTRNNGWWSAFWLYGASNAYATEDGSEIDIFEDYNTRQLRKKGEPAPLALDHNLHVSYGSIRDLKSYNRNSLTPGSVDDFHTIGCKWTPFEITYYLDGKLLENAARGADPASVTFDAFHENAIRAPLHVILSAKIMRSWGNRDLSECKFPESYLVDWVRVWEFPREGLPSVRWKTANDRILYKEGEQIVLEVEAEGDSPVSEVYLFDNGAFVASRTTRPWRFTVPFTHDFFEDETCFMTPGRQRVKPKWDRIMHVFTAYARDEKGRVGVVGDSRWALNAAVERAAPGVRSVQRIPGRLRTGPEPGKYIRWFETGRVRTLETDVMADGKYSLTLAYRSGCDHPNRVVVLVDGSPVASISAPCAPDRDWDANLCSDPVDVSLGAGRHRIALLSIGSICLGDITFERKAK